MVPEARGPAATQRATRTERTTNAAMGAVFLGVLVAVALLEGRPEATFFGSAIEGACLAGGAYLFYAAARGIHVRWW